MRHFGAFLFRSLVSLLIFFDIENGLKIYYFIATRYFMKFTLEILFFVSLYTYDQNKDMFWALCENWCHATNTFHFAFKEACISLLDLYELSGLPFHDLFYEEVILCVAELTSSDDQRRFIPKCCEHLFGVFDSCSSKKKNLNGILLIED